MTVGPRLKHPEWVLFYRQGIRPEKIAELNDVPRAKVVDYLGRIRRHHPELVAGRLMLHDHPRPRPTKTPGRDRPFRAQLRAFVAFVAFHEEHGRRPAAGNPDELPLAHWLVTQRSMDRHGRLPAYRVGLLDLHIPDWRTNTRTLKAKTSTRR